MKIYNNKKNDIFVIKSIIDSKNKTPHTTLSLYRMKLYENDIIHITNAQLYNEYKISADLDDTTKDKKRYIKLSFYIYSMVIASSAICGTGIYMYANGSILTGFNTMYGKNRQLMTARPNELARVWWRLIFNIIPRSLIYGLQTGIYTALYPLEMTFKLLFTCQTPYCK